MKATCLAALLIFAAFEAHAVGRFADVQIVDRDSGAVLDAYRYRGEYWVAGAPGHRYSIMIRNHRGDRLLAVTTVDGVNVISGETGAWGQSGYVYDAGEAYKIDGWRKSNQEIAAFEFTAAPNSYAERTGRPANVGVIGVALFLERPLAPPPVASYVPQAQSPRSMAAQNSAASRAAPAAAQDQAESASRRLSEANGAIGMQPASPPTAKLGTGHGAREVSVVYSTQFDRLSATPNEIIRIRYDSWENLSAMGVIPHRQTPGTVPEAFPDSAVSQYVPDPPSGAPSIRR
jgi:hypothetical protein